MNAKDKVIHLKYSGPKPDQQIDNEKQAALVAEVSIKPGMAVLWLGVILILIGGCISIGRRMRKT
jgi:cytochrome c biogenesis factor